eukprot:TRINITY_DN12503_c1_g4_i1.p2 TRINITY_DN12503_c1_g4~~TRINITY_DN12503_c1_g4_i1.p2  ORF type:complete len:104 (-),score=12.51 TRINITY_DN12503_c1_g4_i1:847-1158(-)
MPESCHLTELTSSSCPVSLCKSLRCFTLQMDTVLSVEQHANTSSSRHAASTQGSECTWKAYSCSPLAVCQTIADPSTPLVTNSLPEGLHRKENIGPLWPVNLS